MDLSALSSNLPQNSPYQRKSNSPPPANNHAISPDTQLLQAFKSAATSVTLLYKTCATATANARQEGYYEALSDVLEAIDNESAYTDPALAVSRIRDWVIDRRRKERHDMNMESEEDERPQERTRENTVEETKHKETISNDKPVHYTPSEVPQDHPFAFQPVQSIPLYPGETTMDVPAEPQHGMFQFSTPAQPIVPRQPALKKQQSNQGLGAGAGSKRRFQYNDFFDISEVHNINTGNSHGNPKKGKYT